MKNEKGQVILILILVMTVGLAIGISVIQRSLSDISTSSKVEQSSRAFSAAEAGIEKTLGTGSTAPFNLLNNSQAQTTDTGLIPAVSTTTRQDPLEYDPLAKEEVAQVWLADPSANLPTCTAANVCYKRPTIDIYWGDPSVVSTDPAAIEITLIYYDGVRFQNRKWYLDPILRTPPNNFSLITCGASQPTGFARSYQCHATLGDAVSDPLPSGLMLIRARLLYNNISQPFAVQAVGCCGNDYSLPPQARVLIATGTSGQTQRKVRLFQISKVVPQYFDYAIFSAGTISK